MDGDNEYGDVRKQIDGIGGTSGASSGSATFQRNWKALANGDNAKDLHKHSTIIYRTTNMIQLLQVSKITLLTYAMGHIVWIARCSVEHSGSTW